MNASKSALLRLLKIGCGIGVISCFVWLGSWILVASNPTFPNSDNPLKLYANQRGTDLQLLFCQFIKQAKHSITLEMYALTDPSIIHLLASKIKENITVRILSDPTACSPALETRLPGAQITWHQKEGLMHRKLLIVDHELTLLGSVNLTTSSLTLHDNFAMAIQDPALAQFFETHGRNTEQFFCKGRCIEAYKLPIMGKLAKAKIIQVLSHAKHSIYVAMFTLTDSALIDALIQAYHRGVDVQVALDYYTAGGSSKKACDRLMNAGISVTLGRGPQLLHHKWAVIDNHILIAGSANWTKSAFARNLDDFVILYSLTEEEKAFMLKLWRTVLC